MPLVSYIYLFERKKNIKINFLPFLSFHSLLSPSQFLPAHHKYLHAIFSFPFSPFYHSLERKKEMERNISPHTQVWLNFQLLNFFLHKLYIFVFCFCFRSSLPSFLLSLSLLSFSYSLSPFPCQAQQSVCFKVFTNMKIWFISSKIQTVFWSISSK